MNTHVCIPKISTTCPACGSPYSIPEFCTSCGMDISPTHICQLKPIIHTCHFPRISGNCLICHSPLPVPTYCTSCGMDISEPHICVNDQLPFNTYRPPLRNFHTCIKPIHSSRCHLCGMFLPPPAYCGICGMDISAPHTCIPKPLPHICRPLISSTRCNLCGEMLPLPTYCHKCGLNITESHSCRSSFGKY